MCDYKIVAAHEGFFVLEKVFGDGDVIVELQKKPVIAWAIETLPTPSVQESPYFITLPITINGFDPDEDSGYILKPDGTITYSDTLEFRDLESALIHANKQHEVYKTLHEKRSKQLPST